ncbi:hypothetical protein RAE13_11415, partial [Corynebacterium curieae]
PRGDQPTKPFTTGYGLGSRLALRLVGLPPKSIDLVATKHSTTQGTHAFSLPHEKRKTIQK